MQSFGGGGPSGPLLDYSAPGGGRSAVISMSSSQDILTAGGGGGGGSEGGPANGKMSTTVVLFSFSKFSKLIPILSILHKVARGVVLLDLPVFR